MIVSKQYGGWGMGDLAHTKNAKTGATSLAKTYQTSPSDKGKVAAAAQGVIAARTRAAADLNPVFYGTPDPGAVDAAVAKLKKTTNEVAAKYGQGAYGISKAEAQTNLAPVAPTVSPAAPAYRALDTAASSAVKAAAAQVLATPAGMPFAKAIPVASPAVREAAAALVYTPPTAADAAAMAPMSTPTGGGGGGGGGGDVAPADDAAATDEGAPVSWWEGLSTPMKVAVMGGSAVAAFIAYKMIRKHR
jgi:hypothetical protein